VSVGGRRLYDAARKGQTLEAPPRQIHVDAFDLLVRRGDEVDFRVICGGGTYVRVLAADVGAALGCGAHLTRLRREAIGPFEAVHATPPQEPGSPLPVDVAVTHLPRMSLEPEEAIAAGHGRILGPSGIDGPFAVYSDTGHLIGVYEDEGTKSRPLVILAPLG
jgi:tRNA pseudouridine55 synthase